MSHKSLAAAVLALAATTSPAVAAGHPVDAMVHQPYHLVITVTDSGTADGTYELYCDPRTATAYGQHPAAEEACETLHAAPEPFAAVSETAMCTYMYGGPATADVSGTWAGRPVTARFTRSNGCEIARWDALVPALPRIGSDAG